MRNLDDTFDTQTNFEEKKAQCIKRTWKNIEKQVSLFISQTQTYCPLSKQVKNLFEFQRYIINGFRDMIIEQFSDILQRKKKYRQKRKQRMAPIENKNQSDSQKREEEIIKEVSNHSSKIQSRQQQSFFNTVKRQKNMLQQPQLDKKKNSSSISTKKQEKHPYKIEINCNQKQC